MPARRRTLRGRVSLLALAVIAGWVVAVAFLFDVVAIHRLRSQVDDSLRLRAQAASALLSIRAGAITGVNDSETDHQLDAGTWIFAGGRLIEHPPASAAVARAVERVRDGTGFVSADGHRLYTLPVRAAGRRIGSIVVAVSTDTDNDTEHTIVVGSALVALLILAGAYPVLRVTAGRALRPVARMAAQAAEWSATTPIERFGGGGRYDELRTLARSLDQLLDRLDAVLRHERQLSGELSHELRTPLTQMLGEIELLADRRLPGTADVLTVMRDACLTMNAIVDAALATTRAELVGRAARTAVGDVLAGYTSDGPPRITVARNRALTTVEAGVEAGVLTRILNPLVDNGRRHARSEVVLGAGETNGHVRITVEDDGPGVPPDAAARIFEPGWTRTEDGHAGAGLGLPLARRLARAADGDLYLDADSDRTRFVVELPRG